MSTRCSVCAQEATKKCTDCGEVFCDLHIRLAGQVGSSRAGSIGYFCDECWERRARRTRSSRILLIIVGLVLLGANLLGFLVFRSSLDAGPRTALFGGSSILATVLVILVVLAIIVTIKRRRF
jgi:hypothetical protein